jgi:hypothetical protein
MKQESSMSFSWRRWIAVAACSCASLAAAEPPRIRLLFLGDDGHHQPAARFHQLEPVLKARGIDMVYSDKVADLNPGTLGAYDGLMVYANTTQISPKRSRRSSRSSRAGRGSYRSTARRTASSTRRPTSTSRGAVPAAPHRSSDDDLRAAAPDPARIPRLRGWDETYVHTKEKDRTVLSTEDVSGREPWTWVRPGQGRVFTA